MLGTIRAIGLDRLLGKPIDKGLVPLAIALIASRLIAPVSKLATARELAAETTGSSLGRLLALCALDEVELYRALDWLGARQARSRPRSPAATSRTRLCSMTSPWPGSRSVLRAGALRPLGDGKKGKLQIVHGLLCAADGCPVAVEVFEGITADPMTLATQIDKLKEPFGLSRVVLVGDRRHDHQCPHPRRVCCKEIRHERPPQPTLSGLMEVDTGSGGVSPNSIHVKFADTSYVNRAQA